MSGGFTGGASWRAPVLVRIGHGSSERVMSAAEAIHYLENRWPHERGSHYIRALNLCKTAREGAVPAEEAKEAFISAAIEARVYAH